MNSTAKRQDEWLITDGCGEFIAYYNPTGLVMHFTRSREEAWKTTSPASPARSTSGSTCGWGVWNDRR